MRKGWTCEADSAFDSELSLSRFRSRTIVSTSRIP